MVRVAVAGFLYEGNSFSLKRDDREDFARVLLAEGDAIRPLVQGKSSSLSGAMEVLDEAGYQLLPLLIAKGVSGGGVVEAFYQSVRANLLSRLEQAMPLDGVYLALHGAMICGSLGDPEGDLLAAVRAVVGPKVPIAASLDLHAHVTPAMVEAADILVGYELYPHLDAHTTGRRAADLLRRTIQGEIRPVMRLRRINAIVPVLGGATHDDAPMGKVRQSARDHEQAGRALSVSYFPVQPWLDFPDVGIAGLAVTDGDADGAFNVATHIAQQMWDLRREFDVPLYSAEGAIRTALRRDAATVLIVDAPDSVGAGASGDSPAVLAAMLRLASTVDAAVCLVDGPAAQQAHQAGAGATLDFSLGASLDRRYHRPVQVTASIEKLSEGQFIYSGGPTAGARADLGPSALLRVGSLRIVVVTHPFYEFADEHYRLFGIDIGTLRLVAFKNLMNFRTLLAPGVDWIAVDEPGASPPRLDGLEWQRKQRPFWPEDDAAQPCFLDGPDDP